MKKAFFTIFYLSISNILFAQQITTLGTNDWNTLRYSGFYESTRSPGCINMPNQHYDYFWGINIAHVGNKNVLSRPYHWGGQIAFGINRANTWPAMYIRSTTEAGEGKWSKVLTENGNQSVSGNLSVEQDIYAGANITLANGELTYILNDNFNCDNKKMGNYAMKWVTDSWRTGTRTLWLSGFGGIKLFTARKPQFVINTVGNVGIGTDDPKNKLDVDGIIRATEVRVEASPWADFVFDEDYKLRSLQDVKTHIDEHKHLPDIPSEKEVKENGVSLGEMQAKLLQKIEELTLYVIKQDEKIQEQTKQIQSLRIKLEDIKK